MDQEELMEMVITELTEQGFRQQRKENEQVDQLIKKRVELKEQVKQCTSALDSESKQVLEDYHDIIDEIAGFQNKYIYLQGAKDCVRLLKTLELL